MPARTYMGIDARRDHGFKVPRPDLSESIGVPNACNGCHLERTARWAAEEIDSRFADSRLGEPHFGQVLSGAWQGNADLEALFDLLGDPSEPAIVRASALSALAPAATPALAQAATRHLSDDDPLVRRAAIAVQLAAGSQERLSRLAPMLDDPFRSVRLEATRHLLDISQEHVPLPTVEILQLAIEDYRSSLNANADFPENQLAIAGVALAQRRFDDARAAFRRASHLDPQLEQAWIMQSQIALAQGDLALAKDILKQALAANPQSHAILRMLAELPP